MRREGNKAEGLCFHTLLKRERTGFVSEVRLVHDG